MRELDLHGYTTDEALRIFVDVYNRQLQNGSIESLRLIHGYGSSGEGGKIRRKIRTFLSNATDSLDWKSGDDVENNSGTTIVYPHKPLPPAEERLAAAILVFCSTPRTESKIAAEFRQHSPREIKQAIRTLVRQSRIKQVFKAGREAYVSAGNDETS